MLIQGPFQAVFPPVSAMHLKSGPWVRFRSTAKWVAGKPWRHKLHDILGQDAHLARLVQAHPMMLRPLVRVYLDRRTPLWTRQSHFAADFSRVSAWLPPDSKAILAASGRVTIARFANGFSLSFGVNEIYPEEGIWALSVRDNEDRRVFHLTFGLLSNDRIVVGSVQGGRKESMFDPQAAIRSFTKACHGLRPQAMLTEALAEMRQVWGCRSVEFVSPRFQARSRWHRPPRNVQFDYDQYFSECGMTRLSDALWGLPTQLPRKSLDEVESNKRSMYRKRFALLDTLRMQCRSGLSH